MSDQPPTNKTDDKTDDKTNTKLNDRLSRIERLVNTGWVILAGVAGVVALWFIIPFVMVKYISADQLPDRAGELGDIFGTVNALFASLAFLLLVITSIQNRTSIKIQQQELEENRKVLEEQADAQQEMITAINFLAKQTQRSMKVDAITTIMNHKKTMFDEGRAQGFKDEVLFQEVCEYSRILESIVRLDPDNNVMITFINDGKPFSV